MYINLFICCYTVCFSDCEQQKTVTSGFFFKHYFPVDMVNMHSSPRN